MSGSSLAPTSTLGVISESGGYRRCAYSKCRRKFLPERSDQEYCQGKHRGLAAYERQRDKRHKQQQKLRRIVVTA